MGFEGILPPQIQKLELETCVPLSEIPWRASKLSSLVEAPSWILAVAEDGWKEVPRTLEKVLEPCLFPIPVSSPSIISNLPQRLTDACFDGVPSTLRFAYLKHLHVQARTAEDFDRLGLLLCGGLKHTLEKLTIGGKYMLDPSVLDHLTGSKVKELVIEWCDPNNWSCLSREWASNISSLTIKKGPWMPCSRVWRDLKPLAVEGGEEWDFEKFWPFFFHHSASLTHLSLGPGCLDISGDPSFIPKWPRHLKSLVLYDAIPILEWPSPQPVSHTKPTENHYGGLGSQKYAARETHTLERTLLSQPSYLHVSQSYQKGVEKDCVQSDSEMGGEGEERMKLGLWGSFPPGLLHLDMPAYGSDHISPKAFLRALKSLPKGLITLRLRGIQLESKEEVSSQMIFKFLRLPSNRLSALYDTEKAKNWVEHLGRPGWDEALTMAMDAKRSASVLAPSSRLTPPFSFKHHITSKPHRGQIFVE
jgi:hypothetical protein